MLFNLYRLQYAALSWQVVYLYLEGVLLYLYSYHCICLVVKRAVHLHNFTKQYAYDYLLLYTYLQLLLSLFYDSDFF